LTLNIKYLKIIILLLLPASLWAQTIKGYVYSSDNTPVPYAHVYVKHTSIGTTTDEQGRYTLKLDEGDYEIVISNLGYKTTTIPMVLYKKDQVKNFWLEPSSVEVQEIEVKAKRRDPAYDVIKKAIEARKDNFRQVMSSKSNVYIKAKEIISEREKKKREKEQQLEENAAEQKDSPLLENPEDQKKAEQQKKTAEQMKLANSMNMVEIQMERHYQYPDLVKEIRNAYEAHGSAYDLFFLNTTENNFNFYSNLISADNLNEVPLISPLNATSIISYKFRLDKTWFEGNSMIYHIIVEPRKQGNATFTGSIDIVNGSFAIRRVDLSLHKGGLLFYDDFRIKQEYELFNDTLWMVTRQEFDYFTKAGNRDFKGNTVVKFDNFEFNVSFPKRYFKNEISVTTQEAYERDSTYWDQIRPEPLTIEEQRIIFIQDSLEGARNKKEYLDSIDRAYNKVTWGDFFLWGIGNFNREKEQHIWVSGITGFINPIAMGGVRSGPDFLIFKRFKNKRYFTLYSGVNYGYRNKDVKGSASFNYMYNPRKLSRISFQAGQNFDVVQPNYSFAGMMDRTNWVLSRFASVGHSHEVFNGFYLYLSANVKRIMPIDDYTFGNFSENFVKNNVPRSFSPYNLVSLKAEIRYTPFQKFMTEPYQKIVLGSKWPTFSLSIHKGIPDIFDSKVNFDYLEFSVYQDFKISTIGTSTAKVGFGQFLNTKLMQYENYKIFPRGDKWFFSTPMQNQLQDSTLITDDKFFEAHYVHHFNGAIENNIPFFKKLKIYTLAGGNYTYIPQHEYHYYDFYYGVEKSFRIQRQRYRIGIYFVYGGSNRQLSKPAIQFSINHYGKNEKSWEY